MALWGKRSSDGNDAAQAIFPGAVCCMLVGEPVVDPQTGEERRALCGAVATAQWITVERHEADGEAVSVVIPLCAAHKETYRAAVRVADREVYPLGTFARWEADANEQEQEILDTLAVTLTERLRADLGASDTQITQVFTACAAALQARETAILKPQLVTTTAAKGKPHRPVQLV